MPNPNKLSRDGAPAGGAVVTLGEHTYSIVPQRIGYLRSKLGVVFAQLTAADVNTGNALDLVLGRAHEMLAVFIPDLMPRYEFDGYATEEAAAAGTYDERYDKSPSPAQVQEAFVAAMSVNKLDLVKHLGKIVDPTMLRELVSAAIADSLTTSSSSSSLPSTATT